MSYRTSNRERIDGIVKRGKKKKNYRQIRLFFNTPSWQSFKEQNRVRRLTSENSYGTPVGATLQLAIGMLRDWPFKGNMEIQLRAIYPPLLAGEGVEQTTRNTLAPYTRVYNTGALVHERTSVAVIVTCLLRSPLFKKRWVTTVVNYEMWHRDIYRLIGCCSNNK